MAKRNLFLGTASGKIGDIVVYRAGGTQRSRVRVIPKDAKTAKQMSQRSKIGGVVNTYRAAKGLLQDTFETRKSNQSPYNAFAQEALPTAPYLLKEVVDANGAIPMPMKLSMGSVPTPFAEQTIDNTGLTTHISAPGITDESTSAELAAGLKAARPCCFTDNSVIIGVKIVYVSENGVTKPYMQVEKLALKDAATWNRGALNVLKLNGDTDEVILGVKSTASEVCVMGIIVANEDTDGIHVTTEDGYLSTAAATAYNNAITDSAAEAAAESWKAAGGSCVL